MGARERARRPRDETLSAERTARPFALVCSLALWLSCAGGPAGPAAVHAAAGTSAAAGQAAPSGHAPADIAAPLGPATAADPADGERFIRQLKRLQLDLLHAGARSKFARLDAIERRLAQLGRKRPKGILGARPPRDEHEAGGPQGLGREAFPLPLEGAGPVSDPRANDRSTDITRSTQSEVSIASWGSYVVAAWNDGEVFNFPGPVGFGTSRDGGSTWTDGGGLPVGNGLLTWTSDPVVTVDEKTGTFYLTALAIAGAPPANAVGVLRGRFTDSGFAWGLPTVARAARDTLPDKPWIAADSLTGHLYLSYTTFVRTHSLSLDFIELQHSDDDNATWSPRIRLSSAHDDGLVQGSRPAVGPDGEVYVVWGAVDTSVAAAGLDHLRLRRSDDGGATFGPEFNPASVYFNFGSGSPGYNRGFGFGFPGIAVDRSDGPYRGRAYVTWMESINYFDDVPRGTGARLEVEPDETIDTPFALGETVRGEIGFENDLDLFSFEGERGQTALFLMDSLATNLDVSLRLFCADGVARLAYSAPAWAGRARFVVFTLPEAGRYLVRVAPLDTHTGGYRIRTGLVGPGPERGRDHRDVFVAHSDDGRIWSHPSRVNDDPPWFENWLPEVVVSSEGRPYVMWYDWRDSPEGTCGSRSNVYLARSDDGGDRWTSLGPFASVATDWSAVTSNLAPNQGDYTGLFAGGRSVHLAWADGREGDPDVRTTRYELSRDPPAARPRPGPRIESVIPNPAAGPLAVAIRLMDDGPATVELFDFSGRRVRHEALAPGAFRRVVRLDTSGLRSGVFVLRVVQGERVGSARVAIVR